MDRGLERQVSGQEPDAWVLPELSARLHARTPRLAHLPAAAMVQDIPTDPSPSPPSSPLWAQLDPRLREKLTMKKEDGEFWYAMGGGRDQGCSGLYGLPGWRGGPVAPSHSRPSPCPLPLPLPRVTCLCCPSPRMQMSDFRRCFDALEICSLSPEALAGQEEEEEGGGWSSQTLRGRWVAGYSAGGHRSYNQGTARAGGVLPTPQPPKWGDRGRDQGWGGQGLRSWGTLPNLHSPARVLLDEPPVLRGPGGAGRGRGGGSGPRAHLHPPGVPEPVQPAPGAAPGPGLPAHQPRDPEGTGQDRAPPLPCPRPGSGPRGSRSPLVSLPGDGGGNCPRPGTGPRPPSWDVPRQEATGWGQGP